MKKKAFTIIITALMVVAMTFNAFAIQNGTVLRPGDATIYTSSNEMGTVRYATGRTQTFHGWMWVNGYCYYFTQPNCLTKLTSCTTPDGYTVDAEGRWTVNGVPQYNGYGSIIVGTNALYAGKSDNERWLVMRGKLEELLANNIRTDGSSHAMLSYDDSVRSRSDYPNWLTVLHNGDGNYIWAEMVTGWADSPDAYSNMGNETNEQIYKILMGDHVGQQFFNEIKAAADPCKPGGKAIKYDENGNWIPKQIEHVSKIDGHVYYTDGCETIDTPSSTDGINWNLFNLAKWQGAKTDYGKTMTFELIPSNAGTQWYKLRIYIK